MSTEAVVALVTHPNPQGAKELARTLVEEGLVACVNLIRGVQSVYVWEGKVHDDPEVLMVVKTRKELCERVQARIDALHPYDTPEFLVLGVDGGSERYLAWLLGATAAPR